MRFKLNRFGGWGMVAITTILLVSGCGSVLQQMDSETAVAEPVQVEMAEPPIRSDSSVKLDQVVESTQATEAEQAVEVAAVAKDADDSIPPLGQISDDFTLVGTTGRPQLVYTFANW